jgi:small subunit ribosomal protein S6
MRPYEVMVILDATLEEADVQLVIDRATEVVTSSGGSVARVDKWGKRRFAYEIDHRVEGYYTLLEVAVGTDGLAEVDRSLRLSDEVIRHKIVRVPNHGGARASRSRVGDLAGTGPDST